jgi:hypothetical protein
MKDHVFLYLMCISNTENKAQYFVSQIQLAHSFVAQNQLAQYFSLNTDKAPFFAPLKPIGSIFRSSKLTSVAFEKYHPADQIPEPFSTSYVFSPALLIFFFPPPSFFVCFPLHHHFSLIHGQRPSSALLLFMIHIYIQYG